MSSSRVDVYRNQYEMANNWLEDTIDGMTPEQVNFLPEGKAHSVGANYCHHVQALDAIILGMLKGGQPLMASTFAGQCGSTEPAPIGDWSEWARTTTVDLDQARTYAQAVYAAVDEYFAGLSDDGLDEMIDLSFLGMGEQPQWFMLNLLLIDTALHTGEISAIKGIQGLKGYPL